MLLHRTTIGDPGDPGLRDITPAPKYTAMSPPGKRKKWEPRVPKQPNPSPRKRRSAVAVAVALAVAGAAVMAAAVAAAASDERGEIRGRYEHVPWHVAGGTKRRGITATSDGRRQDSGGARPPRGPYTSGDLLPPSGDLYPHLLIYALIWRLLSGPCRCGVAAFQDIPRVCWWYTRGPDGDGK